MADGGATSFLEAQSAAHPELASWYAELADLYNRKLWHQLTVKLEQFLAHVLSLPPPKVRSPTPLALASSPFLSSPSLVGHPLCPSPSSSETARHGSSASPYPLCSKLRPTTSGDVRESGRAPPPCPRLAQESAGHSREHPPPGGWELLSSCCQPAPASQHCVSVCALPCD